MVRGLVALAAQALAMTAGAHAQEPPRSIAGPVTAQVVKVRDGDTIEVEAFIWPMQSVHVAVRLRGIDAPEKRGSCDAEKRAADIATAHLSELLASGEVVLTEIAGDKYFGRVLADVATDGEVDVARRMLSDGLVVAYGGKTRRDWCTELSVAPFPSPAPRG
ncbi:thermonuclease family protein [Fulvimarina sp. 2208YS6-2-32]|uniref:Thermonuclease family protein n=1 Tax=Fulvimarina uroteuthidis TaxID=3098149 RepID=A0ABU5I796_9HYPH|nr:thermonuclease family protein [Fulvimarina sp. 2208YS6-2-32]MDY8110997.1 thermonuclease family protein [Fulvimarina sp. 2208YS6-2-32]